MITDSAIAKCVFIKQNSPYLSKNRALATRIPDVDYQQGSKDVEEIGEFEKSSMEVAELQVDATAGKFCQM